MRSRSAVENARISLRLAFPDATHEGLDRAAQLIVRWAAEGVGSTLGPRLSALMYEDLYSVTQSPAPMERPGLLINPDLWVPAPESERTWPRTEPEPPPRR